MQYFIHTMANIKYLAKSF